MTPSLMATLRTAIVVPGHGTVGADGVHRISARCLRLVAEAERLADRISPELVVFSGWSSTGGRSEGEQMRDAWRGNAVELLIEGTARSTAENASRTLPLLLERGIHSAVVVCSPPHLARTRLLFRLYPEHGVSVVFHPAGVRSSIRAVVWELGALPLVPVQLRAARAELDRRIT